VPENNRLFALSSTATTPWSEPTDGPTVLINDAAVALQWYLTHEREQVLDVTIQGSSDGGETWQIVAPDELHAEAEHALTPASDPPQPMQQLLDTAAAQWLDDRIRFVPRGSARARRPCARTFPRRPEHEGPPRQRQPCTTLGSPRHRGSGWRRACFRGFHGSHQSPAHRPGQATKPTRRCPCRPGLLIPGNPTTPSTSRHPSHHPATF
jgi:hypothetical protein